MKALKQSQDGKLTPVERSKRERRDAAPGQPRGRVFAFRRGRCARGGLLVLQLAVPSSLLVPISTARAAPVPEALPAFCSASKAPPRSFFGWETVSGGSTTWDQATISVPRLGSATPFAAAWVMASNGKPLGVGAVWDQVGWYWWSGRLYLLTWSSNGKSNGTSGCPGTSYELFPNVLHAEKDITVAVSRSGASWKNWEKVGKVWKMLDESRLALNGQVVWSTMLEALPDSVATIPQVCISGRVMNHSRLPGGCTTNR